MAKSGRLNNVHRLKTEEMKFMNRVSRYSLLDQRRDEDILELQADSVEKKLKQFN